MPVHHETCTPSIPQQPLSDDSGLQPLQPDKHSAAEADGATAQADVHQPGKPAVQDQDQQQQQHAVVSDSDSTQLPKRADSSFSDSTEDSLAPRTSVSKSTSQALKLECCTSLVAVVLTVLCMRRTACEYGGMSTGNRWGMFWAGCSRF